MFDETGSLKRWYAKIRKRVRGLVAAWTKAELSESEPQALSRIDRDIDRLLAQAEAFHRSIGKMKRVSGELERLREQAEAGAEDAGRRAKGFLFATDKIGNLAQHSKTNIEEAVEQLTLFAEIARGLSRDFNKTVRHIEANLSAFHELNALLNDRLPQETKEERETTDRM